MFAYSVIGEGHTDQLIHRCLARERSAQNRLYELYSPKLFVVCLRFSRNRQEAEETLQEGFLKIFSNIRQFRRDGSFEGWARKIMVNTALEKYRGKLKLRVLNGLEKVIESDYVQDDIMGMINAKEMMRLIQLLPAGYRIVFNLFIFEGLKHREISGLLGISEGTSKSNLHDARKRLQLAVINSLRMAV